MEICFPLPVQRALSLLWENGFEGYAVGGCVRDSLLQKTPDDWDITTSALPEQMKQVFLGFRLVETGIKHGTLTVLIDGMALEITTYRIDGSYSDNRRPDKVTFTASLKEDLSRRDFTINAIAAAPKKGIFDPFLGQRDLENKTIRTVGDPNRRFEEDALRILRGVRFSSVLGFNIEDQTKKAMNRQKNRIGALSAERCFAELKKMLCGKNIEQALLNSKEVITALLPELAPLVGFEQKTPYHLYDIYTHTVKSVAAIENDPVLRLAMLLHDIGKPSHFTVDQKGQGHFKGHPETSAKLAETALARLKCDSKTLAKVVTLIRYHDADIPAKRSAVLRLLNKLGEQDFLALIAVKKADNAAQNLAFSNRSGEYDEILLLYRQIKEQNACFTLKELAVKGSDVKAMGYRGEQIGRALQFLLNAVINGAENERETLLALLKKQDRSNTLGICMC